MSYEVAYCVFCIRRGLDATSRESEALFRESAAYVMNLPFRWFTDGPIFDIPSNLCDFTPPPSEPEPPVVIDCLPSKTE